VLRAVRQNQLELTTRSTERLVARMNAAAGMANTKVLLHPTTAHDVASNHVSSAVDDFHERLVIERGARAGGSRRCACHPKRGARHSISVRHVRGGRHVIG
jgi:hypothetical protein